jgi:predicted transcriptional regulator/DNA-binding XRE family transcriptional regulator
MVSEAEKKLFLGARLRRLRRELGLTQSGMAEDLGVSPSYLNHLERNQRPVTAQVLLRLADAYDLDLRALAAEPEGSAGFAEVFADPMFQDMGLPRHEISEMAGHAPVLAEAVVRLYQAFLDRGRLADLGAVGRPEDGTAAPLAGAASDWVRDHIQAQRNYFPELEEAAEAVGPEMGDEPESFAIAARDRLTGRFGVQVRVAPTELMPDLVRRYDHHRKRLFVSERLTGPGRVFAVAYQLALMEFGAVIDALVERAAPPDRPTRSLLKVSLANYAAAALMMPYARFHEAMEKNGYDIELVQPRFGVSFEQACHRLTTLSRPGARGVPFFMLRVDAAGNVSKRFAGAAFPFSRFGGACPRWNVHTAFRTPGRIITQVVETPDGQRYFTLSRTVRRAAAPYAAEDSDLAVGMGCDLKHAARLAYARGLDLAAPLATAIGPACRICERPNCPQRAAEPVGRSLMVDDFSKSVSPYPFVPG